MHYKSEPNSLKYRSAQFLLENLSYHSSYSVDDAKEFEDVYATMANYPKELRDILKNKRFVIQKDFF